MKNGLIEGDDTSDFNDNGSPLARHELAFLQIVTRIALIQRTHRPCVPTKGYTSVRPFLLQYLMSIFILGGGSVFLLIIIRVVDPLHKSFSIVYLIRKRSV